MITPIEVVDSAVKIGLGALISGIATYLLARANYRKEMQQEHLRRRTDLLEGVAQQVAVFDQAVVIYLRSLVHWLMSMPGTEMSGETFTELSKLNVQHQDAGKELKSAEAKLLLLGEVNCQKHLRDYIETARVPRLSSVAARLHTKEEIRMTMEQVREKRESFYAELSYAYKRI